MRRINLAVALTILPLASLSTAQQTTSNIPGAPQTSSPIVPPGPIISGDGTPNYIPLWATRNYLRSSTLYQASNGNMGIGTTTPGATLDVNGNISTAISFQIGKTTVLNIGSAPDQNVFVGIDAGSNDVAGDGYSNTFVGNGAGHSTTTGCCNTFVGSGAGYSNATGFVNAFYGYQAGYHNTTGAANTFTGTQAGYSNTTGGGNTFLGWSAGQSNTFGSANTFLGDGAGFSTTLGNSNTFTGYYSGVQNTSGNENAFFGYAAGYSNRDGFSNVFFGDNAGYNNVSGSNDIYIANNGPLGGTESNAIRIGDPSTQATSYVAGIYGATSSGGIPVYVNSNGQLGTQTSSLRFKEQVREMGDSSAALMHLRPVTFVYKPEYANGEHILQYGLIAEEVAKVYPELVAYDKDGQPYSVRYQYLNTMLLNEVQKQYRRAEAEAAITAAQEQKITDLEQRLSRLEAVVGARTNVAMGAAAPRE
jgi:hypothetical protein